MAALRVLQSGFQEYLLESSGGVASAVRPGGIGAQRRLAIYHRAYRMRLLDTLRDTFGHTLIYVGSEWFDESALAYVEANPSRHASLREYGASFAGWLLQRHPDHGEVGELAALDWALRHAFDGPDAPVLTPADLGALPAEAWGRVGFVVHPTTVRLQLQHNTLALWQALDDEHTPPPAALRAQPGELLIWRRGQRPHFRSLQPLEAAAIDMLRGGLSFAAVCARLSEQFAGHDTAITAGTLLRRWLDEELLSAVTE